MSAESSKPGVRHSQTVSLVLATVCMAPAVRLYLHCGSEHVCRCGHLANAHMYATSQGDFWYVALMLLAPVLAMATLRWFAYALLLANAYLLVSRLLWKSAGGPYLGREKLVLALGCLLTLAAFAQLICLERRSQHDTGSSS